MKLLFLPLLMMATLSGARLSTLFPFTWTVESTAKPITTTTLPPELTKPSQDDFLVLSSVKEESDLDPDQVAELEKSGVVDTSLRTVLRSRTSKLSLESSLKSESLPPAYQSAANSSVSLFDSSSSKNELHSLPLTISDPRGLYHCPHNTHLLRWFPLYYAGKPYEICFIPWATNQAITYAKCSTSSCPTRYYYTYSTYTRPRYGRCYASCYLRLRITAYCVNVSRLTVAWKTIYRSLPQACRCSTTYIK